MTQLRLRNKQGYGLSEAKIRVWIFLVLIRIYVMTSIMLGDAQFNGSGKILQSSLLYMCFRRIKVSMPWGNIDNQRFIIRMLLISDVKHL